MNYKVIILLLIIPLCFCGCSGKNKSSNKVEVGTGSNKVLVANKNSQANAEGEELNSSESDSNVNTSVFNKELIDRLIEDSTYISKVRIQNSSANGAEANFLADYVGDLSNIELDLPKTLSPNKEYLVFYRDTQNGTIEPTRSNESFIEIQDENDGNLIYLQNKFVKTGRN